MFCACLHSHDRKFLTAQMEVNLDNELYIFRSKLSGRFH